MGRPTEEQLVKYARIFKIYPEAHCSMIRITGAGTLCREKVDLEKIRQEIRETPPEWYVFGFRKGGCLIGHSFLSEDDAWERAAVNFDKGNIALIAYPS